MRLVFYLCAFVALTVANDETQLSASIEQFTAKMYPVVANYNSRKSFVMSALSVMPPLGQLALASEGETHGEILNSIGLPNDDVVKNVFSHMTRELTSLRGVELRMTNRVYVSQEVDLNSTFADESAKIFNSDAKKIDFNDVQAATEINTWVEQQTNNLIKDLVSPYMLRDANAVLVNAIYFKGLWKYQFDKVRTADRYFHVTRNKLVKIPTMHSSKHFGYGESIELGAKLLELHYEGEQSSLLIILPNEIGGLPALEEKLMNTDLLNEALNDMYDSEVDVYLPKFKIETEIDLKQVLQNVGINKLFTSNAELTKLISTPNTPVYIGGAKQKAFIEIDEEGTEAAASSAFIGLYVAAPSSRPEFKADRPFYFAVRIDGKVAFNGHFVG